MIESVCLTLSKNLQLLVNILTFYTAHIELLSEARFSCYLSVFLLKLVCFADQQTHRN